MGGNYSTIKYRGYIIEGRDKTYTLYHSLGIVGDFPTCKDAKAYVDRERNELDENWNRAVIDENL